jgi:high-affinity nickel-transport protein
MGMVVAAVSFLVAGLAIARLGAPVLAHWSEGKELVFGASVVLLIAASFMLAMRLARPAARVQPR